MEGRMWKCALALSLIISISSAADRQHQQQQPQLLPQLQGGQYQQISQLGPPQASTGPHQFTPEARQFPPPPPIQVQFPSRAPQQQILQVPLYLQQEHEQQFKIQLVPDNYNHPQYLFIQQSNSPIPVSNKQGGIEYVQYIDPNTNILANLKTQTTFNNHNHKATHNLAGLILKTAYTNVLPVNYRQPAPQTYRVQGMAQPLINQNVYVIPPPVAQQPINQLQTFHKPQQQQSNQVLSQQRILVPPPQQSINQFYQQQQQKPYNQVLKQQSFSIPGIIYAQNEQQPQQSITNIVYEKREPQSLLESYIPSYLQIDYYKEVEKQQKLQQLEQNSFQGNGKQ